MDSFEVVKQVYRRADEQYAAMLLPSRSLIAFGATAQDAISNLASLHLAHCAEVESSSRQRIQMLAEETADMLRVLEQIGTE